MARKSDGNSSGGTNVTAARSGESLRGLRSQVDRLDVQLLKLLHERVGLAARIGRVKTDSGEEIFSPAREEEVYKHVLEANQKLKEPLDPNTVRAVFRELMSASRAMQKVLKVAYLGPEYSFSHLAAVERFGQAAEFLYLGSIP